MQVSVQPGSRVLVRDENIAVSVAAVLWSLPSTLSPDHSVKYCQNIFRFVLYVHVVFIFNHLFTLKYSKK